MHEMSVYRSLNVHVDYANWSSLPTTYLSLKAFSRIVFYPCQVRSLYFILFYFICVHVLPFYSRTMVSLLQGNTLDKSISM